MPVASFRVHGVRYQTRDVNRAVAFYTQELGFELKHQQGAAFASVSCGPIDVLSPVVTAMKDRGLSFRSDIVVGPGGRQIQLLDPDGNPIELFEPASAGTRT